MKHTLSAAILALALLCGAVNASGDGLTVRVTADKSEYALGDTVIVILDIAIPQHSCLYGNPLGPGIGKPVRVWCDDMPGIQWTGVRKMPAERIEPAFGEWVWAYRNRVVFFVTGVVGKGARGMMKGGVCFDGLVCQVSCTPVSKRIGFEIAVSEHAAVFRFEKAPSYEPLFKATEAMEYGPPPRTDYASPEPAAGGRGDRAVKTPADSAARAQAWDYTPVEKVRRYNLLLALVFGFLAGLLLNVMPCVLPVLGIKVLALSQGTGATRRKAVVRSLVFSAGMVLVFVILASLAAFANFSWGEQFQRPRILALIICLIILFGLGMFDFYAITLPSKLGTVELKARRTGLTGDFLRGILTSVMATPCSGPFLGATLAWTLRQPVAVIYTVFVSIGLGMACPYVLLSASTTLQRLVPKPGRWMEDFKHALGFLLLGFALYLMSGLPPGYMLGTVTLSLFFTVAIAFFARFSAGGGGMGRTAAVGAAAFAIAAAGLYANRGMFLQGPAGVVDSEDKAGFQWYAFSAQAIRKAHMDGRHVIVDFTAAWCMNCQYNKMMVLDSREITEALRTRGVLALRADITAPNPAAMSLLEHLGSRSVPFLAIFPGDDPYNPVIMRDVLHKPDVLKAIRGLPQKEGM